MTEYPTTEGEAIIDSENISYGELATLTHVTQVELFGWCACEDLEDGQDAPYADCTKDGR